MRPLFPLRRLLLLTGLPGLAGGADIAPDQREFFESKIRPVLVAECYGCHGAEKKKGGLRLDFRDALRAGGDSGPLLNHAAPEQSLLIQSLAHTHPDSALHMPKEGARLSAAVVSDFVTWIRAGAPDPRDTAAPVTEGGSWEQAMILRKKWWSFLPVTDPPPPDPASLKRADWSPHPVDRFLLLEMEKAGLEPAADTDAPGLLRRLTFLLTGLPPSPEETAEFTAAFEKDADLAVKAAAEKLLASPHFGERQARHWMDLMRYAETYGSEGDPAIPQAWRYRDYLIRAFNADLPYPQFVREQIAGDLLPDPRIAEGVNESALGIGQLRMVLHGFTPTDALDEMVSFTDNQIDTVTKSFLGLTVSCARCHNHKFDAISQADFYALYGIFTSTRPAVIDAASPAKRAEGRIDATAAKRALKDALLAAWEAEIDALPARLEAWKPETPAMEAAARGNGNGPLAAWLELKDTPPETMAAEWTKRAEAWKSAAARKQDTLTGALRWDLGGDGAGAWHVSGPGVTDATRRTADFLPESAGDRVVSRILPPGLHSAAFSTKDRAVATSPEFPVSGGRVWLRTAGAGGAVAKYVVRNYPRTGLIFPKKDLTDGSSGWVSWDVGYWKGETMHLQLATASDQPAESLPEGRSWFSVSEAVWLPDAAAVLPELGAPVFAAAAGGVAEPADRAALARTYQETARRVLAAWRADGMTSEQAEFLDFLARGGLLSNALSALPGVASAALAWRAAEEKLAPPVRAPGVLEGQSADAALYVRGDHKQPGPAVPRRFLEAIDPAPYHTTGSGRLELAASMTSPGNPLTARVMVNRLWKQVYGKGIAATPDNFGRLGEAPTHPALLDHLAEHFTRTGGSVKELLTYLVTARAFRLVDRAAPAAAAADPGNKLLSHASPRRLEAESIRDSMLAVSGKLDETLFGPPVDTAAPRRAVYVRVIRNDPEPFLAAFDAPMPTQTRGSRDATNVPAQPLAMMNDPMVASLASAWAERHLTSEPDAAPATRVDRMWREAFGRAPSARESADCLAFLETSREYLDARQAETLAMEQRVSDLRTKLEAELAPLRAARKPEPAGPVPTAEWDFAMDATDRAGALPLTLHGAAKIEQGALVLDGRDAWAETAPLPFTLHAKTLEAWVTLDTLDQSGGGVLSVQDTRGDVFDAIVFGEHDPRCWMAGSDFGKRSQAFGGPPEAEAAGQLTHVALVYQADGAVTAYRNGQIYGAPYPVAVPAVFKAGESQILLGCRHGAPTGNRLLSGRIHRARLHDRALSAEEVAVSSRAEMLGDDEALLAALTPEARDRVISLRAALNQQSTAAEELRADTPPAGPWQSLALSLFNLKEFIHLR